MNKQAKLKDIFAAVPHRDGPVWEMPVESVTPEDSGLTVTLAPGAPVSAEVLRSAEAAVCRAYGVARVRLRAADPAEAPEEDEPPFLADGDAPPEPVVRTMPAGDGPFDTPAVAEQREPSEQERILSILRQVFSQKHPSAAPCLREAELSLSGSVLILRAAEE